MAMKYSTYGSVRGTCGHKHKSIAAARKCLEEDQKGCASQGGYSDREIYREENGISWRPIWPPEEGEK